MDHPGAAHPASVAPQGRVIGHLSRLDQLLPLWILLAMASGLLLGRLVPGLQTLLGSVQVGHTSLPIALGLLVMMYPVLAKVRYGELGSVARDRRLLSITLGLTWGLGPLLMFTLAWLFLPDQPAFRTGLILIGIALAVLPIVPGFPLIAVGVLMLVAAHEPSRRLVNRGVSHLPRSAVAALLRVLVQGSGRASK